MIFLYDARSISEVGGGDNCAIMLASKTLYAGSGSGN
jgi:hypothetical protein